jgi:sulfur carrier protein
MRITLNGELCEVPDEATVLDVLGQLGLPSERVAVERNLELVPRANHAATRVAAGDSFEVVTLVGGG